MEALTEQGLVSEVATGAFSFKNKISASCIKTLWDKLARFVADALKQQKGVLLPNLGTFSVGPVVGEVRKKVRPAFTLLETRYSGVSQERPKYTIGGRCPVVQPNYGLLAIASAVHRGTCQRLLLELMQRLGVHILSGRPILVSFPGVGRLYTNRADRIEFEFDTLLREFFELERERVIPEMERGGADAGEVDESMGQLVKGLQKVHLHKSPVVRSRPAPNAAASPPSPSARVKRNAHARYGGELNDLWRLCKSNDRISSGCVPRLQLEQWLAKECPQVLRQVAAATMLELLSTNTYGKTGKHILYKPFLDQLEMAVEKEEGSPRHAHSPRRVVEVRIDSPSSALRRRQLQQDQQASGDGEEEDEAVEVTLSPLQQPPGAQMGQQQSPYWQYPAQGPYQNNQPPPYQQQQPQQQYPPPQAGLYPSPQQPLTQQGQYPYTPQQYPPYTPQGEGQFANQPGQYASQGQQQHNPARPQSQQRPASSQRPPHTPHAPPAQSWQAQGQEQGSDSKPYHYYQNQLSPRSRREFDNFNRLHFEKLEQVRGANYKHRAVTPKVGEDELNRQEYHAMRLGGDGATPAQVLRLPEDPPYTHDTPHPIVSAQRRRGSPGPKPQILTLAHEPPPQYAHVPGLPTHVYQPQHHHQQQQAGTPTQPHGARQPPPLQRPFSGRQPTPTTAADESPPISQYDIINEADPRKRQQKRNELANALNRNWSEQIREKEALLENLAEAQAQWPYVPTHRPNDKRPADAVSRPVSAWGPYPP